MAVFLSPVGGAGAQFFDVTELILALRGLICACSVFINATDSIDRN